MAAQDSATIKNNFETGDIPTEAQFADWIDSYENAVDVLHVLGLETTITAVAPPVKGTATVLTKRYNIVETGDAAGAGVRLLMSVINQIQSVQNKTAGPLYVFPASAETIRGLSADEAYELQVGEVVDFLGIGGSIVIADIKGSMVQTADEVLIIDATVTTPVKATTPDIDVMFCKKTSVPQFLEFEYNYGKDGSQTGANDGSGDYLFTLPDEQEFVVPALGFYTGSTDARTFNAGNFAIGGLVGMVTGGNLEAVVYAVPFDAKQFRLLIAAGSVPGQFVDQTNFDTQQTDCTWRFKFVAEVVAKF